MEGVEDGGEVGGGGGARSSGPSWGRGPRGFGGPPVPARPDTTDSRDDISGVAFEVLLAYSLSSMSLRGSSSSSSSSSARCFPISPGPTPPPRGLGRPRKRLLTASQAVRPPLSHFALASALTPPPPRRESASDRLQRCLGQRVTGSKDRVTLHLRTTGFVVVVVVAAGAGAVGKAEREPVPVERAAPTEPNTTDTRSCTG